jgi:hypothetical protein
MEIEFFSRTKNEAAIKAIEEIMSAASTCLQIEMCYVTDYGVKLLNRQKEKLLRPGSFIVVSDDPTNDLEGLNMLAELRPDSVLFHSGIDSSGEGPASGIMHAKIIYAENDEGATLWVGSHNLTKRGLAGINIEAAMVYKGHPGEQVFKDARNHLKSTVAQSARGPIKLREKVYTTAKSLIIECEADNDILVPFKKEPTDFCLSLTHELFDKECIPPGDTIRDVRLIVYPKGSMTHEGPQSAPLFIRSGQVTGVTFTEKNTKAGSGARWDGKPGFMRMSLRQINLAHDDSPLIAEQGDNRVDQATTVCSFFVNSEPDRVELHLDGPLTADLEYDIVEHIIVIPEVSKEPGQNLELPGVPVKEPEVVKVMTRSNGRPIQFVPYHGSLNNWHIRQILAFAQAQNITIRFVKIGKIYKFIRRGNLLSTDDKYFVKG